jgi:hypothetical protein
MTIRVAETDSRRGDGRSSGVRVNFQNGIRDFLLANVLVGGFK